MMESSNLILVANGKKWINKLIGVRASMKTLTVPHETIQSSSASPTKYVQLQQ